MDTSNDIHNMKEVLDNFYKQILESKTWGREIHPKGSFTKILYCAIGSSALSAEVVRDYINCKISVLIHRSYGLPQWVDKETLIICSSHLGNTEEVLSAYEEAKRKDLQMFAITSGGKLKEKCIQDRTPYVSLPKNISQRDSIGYKIIPVLNILHTLRLIPDPKMDIEGAIEFLRTDITEQAQEITNRLKGKVPFIYSSENNECLSHIWSIKIIENAKTMAFWNVIPEANYNELLGFLDVQYEPYVILIKDVFDHPRIQKRMDVMKELLQDQGVPVLQLRISQRNRLIRLLSTILLGSYVGYYLALQKGIDPTSADIIEEFKDMMK